MSPPSGQSEQDTAGKSVAGTKGSAPALKVHDVSKAFGAVQANDHISFDVAPGSIHALVGENGAGKTTLMRIVYGLYAPDSGHIELNGEPVRFNSPREALTRGIGMVHQHSLLVNSLSVAENVLLALPGLGRPPRREARERLRALSDANHLRIDPTAQVGSLSVAGRQRAEILSALFHGARFLILDEPTTVLTPQEVEELFVVMRRLRESGTTIMLVTHKLAEVMAISDRVTVLRGGKVVDTVPTRATTDRDLVRMMVGKDVPLRVSDPNAYRSATIREPVLEVERLTIRDVSDIIRVRDVSFQIFPGEIVGITGVEGNGQIELTEALVGLRPATSGELKLGGRRATSWSVSHRRRAGLAYIPESRMAEGINSAVSVRDNLILGRHNQRPYARLGIRNLRATTRFARKLVDDFHVVAPSVDSDAATLSGGNLQKVVVAREVTRSPRLLIAAQPTQGVDVAATHLIRSTLLRLRDEGMGIILVSSDLSEVCDLADRALVLFNGSIFGELRRADLTEEAIGVYAMGLQG
ncbi:MAG TPA: ABC transporter ATP-binding protein [Chloroflexota bacterium]